MAVETSPATLTPFPAAPCRSLKTTGRPKRSIVSSGNKSATLATGTHRTPLLARNAEACHERSLVIRSVQQPHGGSSATSAVTLK